MRYTIAKNMGLVYHTVDWDGRIVHTTETLGEARNLVAQYAPFDRTRTGQRIEHPIGSWIMANGREMQAIESYPLETVGE